MKNEEIFDEVYNNQNNDCVDEFIALNDEERKKDFMVNAVNKRELLQDIAYSLLQLKCEKIELKAVKKLIDKLLNIDDCETEEEKELFKFVDELLENK